MSLTLVALVDLVLVVIARVRAYIRIYDKTGLFATHAVHRPKVQNMKLKTR